MAKKSKAEELADFIEANPNCNFEIDNDCWYITNDKEGDEGQLANDSDFPMSTKWYSSGNLYGAGLAEAMVILLNRRGFNIKASAV